MKTFQKIALVSAIAAAPFAAQAGLVSLEEAEMSNVTGQAGVTIEIDLGNDGIKVGSVVYTDTAHQIDDLNGVAPGGVGYIVTTADGGSVALENISVNLTGTIVQTIDVSETGDLVMTASAPGVMQIAAGNNALDTIGAFSALKLQAVDGSESELVNNLSLDVTLGTSTTTIKNLGTTLTGGMGTLGSNNLVAVGSAYADVASSMAIQMNASAKIENLNVGLFGYTKDQSVFVAAGAAAKYQAAWTAGNAAERTALEAAYDLDTTGAVSDQAALENKIATGSAVQIAGVSVTDANAADGMFSVEQTIWAVGGDASQPGSDAGVYIQMGAMNLDINVAGIGIGGSSIGSIAINGLEMNGLTQRIYGH
jgi:hypothetical protein